MRLRRLLLHVILFFVPFAHASAQFVMHFDNHEKKQDWVTATGDGQATATFNQKDGIGSFHVDATRDTLNIWWAIARHRITGLDMKKLSKPEYELRVETRIRVSHAPRRVNLHVNHQRTTDFHSHLMEFDIPDTAHWHTISMTTHDFETTPGDSINAHLAMMDWGLGKYRVEFDYFRVDVVDRRASTRDLGNPMPYHPPTADPANFSEHLNAMHDATIDTEFPQRNFDRWHTRNELRSWTPTLAVGGTQFIILRWEVNELAGKKVKGSGLLELTPYSVQRSADYNKDFGMVRVCEILDGEPAWDEKNVTLERLTQGIAIEEVINTQMIIDDSVTWNKNGKMLFTISQPVLQRLIDGKTKGIAIRPLGAINATFLGKESASPPRLHLNIER